MKTYPYNGNCESLAKRIMFLAWQASKCLGMGVFQDRGPNQSEEEVWARMYNATDYPGGNILGRNKPGEVRADYVFGRMMKLSIKWTENSVSISDNYDIEYQSFCRKYKTSDDLFDAAVESLN